MPTFHRRVLHAATLVAAALFTTLAPGADDDHAVATFAGGCFWCVEADFDAVDGVIATTSGYIGGHEPDPTYEQVSAGGTGHTEAVEIRYDPDRVSYRELLAVFWVNHDPTTNERQFCDRGSQYRPGIFYHDAEQKRLAEESRREIRESHPFEVVTEITEATTFYEAEAYHQDYYEKNPIRYKIYRYGCGRDARLEELWGERDGP